MIFERVVEVATVWGISIGGAAVFIWVCVHFLSDWKNRREIVKRLEQVMMDLEAGQVFQ